ncbi:MAG: DUF2975 domain-containing protein [Gemmatimonadota bacterium]
MSTESSPDALGLSHRVLRVLIKLNWLLGFLILALLVASLVSSGPVFGALGIAPSENSARLAVGMRLIMVLGIIGVPITNTVLSRLLAIVDTVADGDPFVAENARRLRSIAWAVLGLEVLHLAVVAVAANVSTPKTPIDIRWDFSFTRWLCVLLLFVLARVFEQGARMRDDLEGTV